MKSIAICLLALLCVVKPAFAVVDPLAVPNNKYGIHITNAHDIEAASELVNSTGGEWGYVTLVIQQNNRDRRTWQRLFDTLRERRLIPIVRLATEPEGEMWKKPSTGDAIAWADFLSSLNWVVKNRYIILFNEPNHAKEWGGEVKPHEYVSIINTFIPELKKRSSDYFILPAGFDLSAPNTDKTMDVTRYYHLMYQFDNAIFTRFDGWTSHPYPNPAYASLPTASGKISLRGYRWEQNILTQYGLKPNIPLFITETGWNRDNLTKSRQASVDEKLAAYWQTGFTEVWTDPNIVAITPFLLRYLNPPFTGFSWLDPATDQPLPHYLAVKQLPKISGQPIQDLSSRLHNVTIPSTLITRSRYSFTASFSNTGQSIWDPALYTLQFDHQQRFSQSTVSPFTITSPEKMINLTYSFTTPSEPGTYPVTISLMRGAEPFGESITREINVISPPSLLVKLQLWYKHVSSGSDFTLLMYQGNDLQKKITPINIENGEVSIRELYDIVPGTEYRFVITKPYYLPRQTFATVGSGNTTISFQRLWPFDFYPDGKSTWKDWWYALRYPRNTLNLISL